MNIKNEEWLIFRLQQIKATIHDLAMAERMELYKVPAPVFAALPYSNQP